MTHHPDCPYGKGRITHLIQPHECYHCKRLTTDINGRLHDQLCPAPLCDWTGESGNECMGYEDCHHLCQCDLIAKVREDERNLGWREGWNTGYANAMTENSDGLTGLLRAYAIAESDPDQHVARQDRLREDWPELHDAIQRAFFGQP